MTTTQRQLRRDTTANIGAITPAQGEPVFDVSRNALTLGDGSQAGGHYATPFFGTWTPSIAGATTPGTQAYAVQSGWYCKIGKLVIAQARITLTANSGGAGAARISGLPFQSVNGANALGAVIPVYIQNVTHQSGYTQFTGYVLSATTTADLAEAGSNVSGAAVLITNLGATADLFVMIIYEAAADNN